MPTKKPRINVTLNQRCYDIIKSISESSGQPMSGFIAEMLEAAIPTIERMAVTFQKIKKAQESERSRFIESMDDAQHALEPAVQEAIGQFDLFLGRIEEAAEGKGGTRVRGAALTSDAARTPRTNRGVTTEGEGSRKPRQVKALKPVSKKEVLKKSSRPTA